MYTRKTCPFKFIWQYRVTHALHNAYIAYLIFEYISLWLILFINQYYLYKESENIRFDFSIQQV